MGSKRHAMARAASPSDARSRARASLQGDARAHARVAVGLRGGRDIMTRAGRTLPPRARAPRGCPRCVHRRRATGAFAWANVAASLRADVAKGARTPLGRTSGRRRCARPILTFPPRPTVRPASAHDRTLLSRARHLTAVRARISVVLCARTLPFTTSSTAPAAGSVAPAPHQAPRDVRARRRALDRARARAPRPPRYHCCT